MLETPVESALTIDSSSAQRIANGYLIDHVGDLLGAGAPRQDGGCWIMPIILSTARRGRLGEVGTISVDAATGAVRFSDEERKRVKDRARALAGASSP